MYLYVYVYLYIYSTSFVFKSVYWHWVINQPSTPSCSWHTHMQSAIQCTNYNPGLSRSNLAVAQLNMFVQSVWNKGKSHYMGSESAHCKVVSLLGQWFYAASFCLSLCFRQPFHSSLRIDFSLCYWLKEKSDAHLECIFVSHSFSRIEIFCSAWVNI